MTGTNGFQIFYNLGFGQGRSIERKSLMLMPIVRKLVAFTGLTVASGLVFAANQPSWVQDPVFGLNLNIERARLDPVPPHVVSLCTQLISEKWGRRSWLFATAKDGPRIYYILGGFYVRKSTGQAKTDPVGAVMEVSNGKCASIGPAREVFDAEAEELSHAALESLAIDTVARLAAATGGRKALTAEMRRQHIKPPDTNSLLEKALKDDAAPVR